ncbi:MAG TPA: carboxypeptidase-like regulatory domain-containing protein [Pyrinomonadaceae bacterium]|nr:carboxypeptidase-like regulatory domain-containing protein [Pyrinomonadaceae bacterium]
MRKICGRIGLLLLAAFALSEAAAPLAFATGAKGAGGTRRTSLGTVTGTVRDSRGNPLAGALITLLRDGAEEVVKQTRSAADGSYVARVSPGRYLLRAIAEGFNAVTFEAVQVNASSEVVYRFNLEPAGQGRTTAERRPDRKDPKFLLRSQQRRRSIFQIDEATDPVVEATVAETTTTDASECVEERAPGDEWSRGTRHMPKGMVETYFASSADKRAGRYTGLNFAVATPFSRNFDFIMAGQLGALERLEATGRWRASERHLLSATLGGARLKTLKPDAETDDRSLGQVSLRAVDEWVVRDGVVIVVGIDYSRFVGAGDADSLTPRLGFQFDAGARTRLRAAYTNGADATKRTHAVELGEGNTIVFEEPESQAVAFVDGRAVMERTSRLEFGVERLLDDSSSVEATAFFDTVNGRGVGLFSTPLAALEGEENSALIDIANQQGGARGLRVVYTRRVGQRLKASAGYAFGTGQQLSAEGAAVSPEQLFQDSFFQTASAQVDADVLEGTSVRTVLRFSPRAAVFAIDPFAGRLAVYDPSLSILVTQELPNFGLPVRAEAVLDARNVLDTMTGVEDAETSLTLGTLRRMVRGGISVRF